MKTLDLHDRIVYGPDDEPGVITNVVNFHHRDSGDRWVEYDVVLDGGRCVVGHPDDTRPAVTA